MYTVVCVTADESKQVLGGSKNAIAVVPAARQSPPQMTFNVSRIFSCLFKVTTHETSHFANTRIVEVHRLLTSGKQPQSPLGAPGTPRSFWMLQLTPETLEVF
jgi:hypothetical protein